MLNLSKMFSDYRSEWIVDDFDERFVEPPYYSQFLDMRPTFLIGGRGTGKTIALRSLHFSNLSAEGKPRHMGIYVKAFKNRILAFAGEHVSENIWIAAFQHYMNLLCCLELTMLADLAVPHRCDQRNSIRLLCEYLSVSDPPTTYKALHDQLRSLLANLTKWVVAPKMVDQPVFSPGEQPVVEFARDLHEMIDPQGGPIYICIDEWENLSTPQQQVMNGWIKNSAAPISYKLGVRERGIKTSLTGPGGEDPLVSPADYSEEKISGSEAFCRQVAEKRLALARDRNIQVSSRLSEFLLHLEPREEAEVLGAQPAVKRAADDLARDGNGMAAQWLRQAPLDQAYLAVHLCDRGLAPLENIVAEAQLEEDGWRNKVENYRFASLFTITRGRKGVPLRKIYAGANTFLTLSGGNVRYLLELLDEVVRLYAREHEDLDMGTSIAIDYRTQTRGAEMVAKRHLDRIQGLSNDGVRIARLVRSVGTVFCDLMRNPSNAAPEQTGFVLKGSQEDVDEASTLLGEGCAILAFVSGRPTKLTHVMETQQEDEYSLHPILAPHFHISHRRKRRIKIDAKQLLNAARDLEGAKALHSAITGRLIANAQLDLLSE